MHFVQVLVPLLVANSGLSYYIQPRSYDSYQSYQDFHVPQRRNDRSLENYGFAAGKLEDQYKHDSNQEYIYPTTENDWFVDRRQPDPKNTSAGGIQKRNDHKFGFYNVQTGDEFFLNDFDVRPKFKTKENDKDIFEFEYFGHTTQVTPILYSNTVSKPFGGYNGNRKVGKNKKPSRKPTVNSIRKPGNVNHNVNHNNNRNKNKQTTNKRRPNISTTRRPIRSQNNNKRKPVTTNKQNNRRPAKLQSNCNRGKVPKRNTNQKKPTKRPNLANQTQKKKQTNQIKKPVKQSSSFGQSYSTPQTLVINNVIRRYIEKLQAKNQNRKNDQSLVMNNNRDVFTRKIFNMPTFEDIKNSTMSLTNKFLSLFTVVQFENFQCVANSKTGQYIGTCYHENQCEKMGGFSTGDCANGYGVCCVVRRTCGESSTQNLTYFESMNYPNYFPSQNLNVTQINTQPEDAEEEEEQNPQGLPPSNPNNTPINPSDIDLDIPTLIPEVPNDFSDGVDVSFSFEDDDDETNEEDSTELPEITTESDDYDVMVTTQETTESPNEDVTGHKRYKFHKYHEYKLARQDNMADSLACIFWVYKTSPDIQQMRIDFIDFELLGPSQNGNCLEERFVVSGQNINAPIPVICGYNSGQHFYIDVTSLTGPLQISILSTKTTNKRYKFLVSQLASPCGNSYNCLQYFSGASGTISSFNYEDGSRSNPQYMSNLNYAICLRRESGYCSITYETDGNLFEITNMLNGVDDPENPSTDQCPDDYIVIDNMRVCGGLFNSPITDYSPGPIVIPVRTNPQITGRGFKLNYRQNKCTTSM